MWRMDRRAAWATRLATALLMAVAMPSWALDLSQLMAQLAQRSSGEVRFAEQRFVSGLDQPLRSSGTLSFTAPDRLTRHTLLPRPESFVVEGNRITLERSGRARQTSIDAAPELAAFVTAIRGTLTGDAVALQQHFKPSVAGTPGQWTLTLLPLDDRVGAVVRQLRLEGQHADLRLVEVQLSDGDRSVMTIDAANGPRARALAP